MIKYWQHQSIKDEWKLFFKESGLKLANIETRWFTLKDGIVHNKLQKFMENEDAKRALFLVDSFQIHT